MAEDLEIGTIVKRNTVGKARYIVVDAGSQHEETEEDIKRGYSIADRCSMCDARRAKKDGNGKFVISLCNQLLCDGNRRKDGKHVCWKLYSIGRLSREKIVFKED